jgi:hypothetical protein
MAARKWRKPSLRHPWRVNPWDAVHLAGHGVVVMPPVDAVECAECIAILSAAEKGVARPDPGSTLASDRGEPKEDTDG